MNYVLFILLAFATGLPAIARADDAVDWRHDETAAFAQATREHKQVLLYLEAVWCHWCHVMDHETYFDPKVRQAIAEHFVPLRIDQDARPDLANRYREYGWPATIVFAADGTEIVKRRGYIAPAPMARLLAAIVADPSPESAAKVDTTVAAVSGLSTTVRDDLLRRHREHYDTTLGGLDTAQKYVERDSVEYALALALDGDTQERARALQTLLAGRALIDPVWGGVYQYSTDGDWRHPHYEKLGALQGEYLRVYALAYGITGDAALLDAARDIRRYIKTFLASHDGGYFVSQDADPRPGEHGEAYFQLDDAARRRQGLPRIDTHRYARETGAIAEGLLSLYEYTGDASALADARAALDWALRERARDDGGFRHDARDAAGPYLADTLSMGRAMLAMYRVTGERDWLSRAGRAADFVDANFRARAGFAAAARGASPIAPVPQIDENIALARFANLLSRYDGQDAHRALARHALSWLAAPEVALSRLTEAGILLADREINGEPLHLTVIGPRDDDATRALHQACLRVGATYKRLDWWDRAEGPLPNPDVAYPPLKRPAAFVCTNQRCSVPIVKPEDVATFIAESASAAASR